MSDLIVGTQWNLGHFVALGFFGFRISSILFLSCRNASVDAVTAAELDKPLEQFREEHMRLQRVGRRRTIDIDQGDDANRRELAAFWRRLRDQTRKLWELYLYQLWYEAASACAKGTIVFWCWDVVHDVYERDARDTNFVLPLLVFAVLTYLWKGIQSADVVSFYSEYNARSHSVQQLFDFNVLSQISVAQRTQKDSGHIAWLHKIQVCLLSGPHCVLVLAYIIGKYKDNVDPFFYVTFIVHLVNTILTMQDLDTYGDDIFYIENATVQRIAYRILEFLSRVIILALLYTNVSWLAFVIIFVLELGAFFAYYQKEGYWGNESHYIFGAMFFLPVWSRVELTESGKLQRQASLSNDDLHVIYTNIYKFLQWVPLTEHLIARGWLTASRNKTEIAMFLVSRMIDNTVWILVIILFGVANFNCPNCELFTTRRDEIQPPGGISFYLLILAFFMYIAQFMFFKSIDNTNQDDFAPVEPIQRLHPSQRAFWERDNAQLIKKEFNDWLKVSQLTMHALQLKSNKELEQIANFYQDWQERQKRKRQGNKAGKVGRYQSTAVHTKTILTGNPHHNEYPEVLPEPTTGKKKEVERTPFRDYNINEIRIMDELKFFEDDYVELDPIGDPGAFGIASKCRKKDEPGVILVVKKILKVKFYTLDQKSRDELVETMRNEIEILGMIDHPNVVGLLEVYEDQDWLNLILELCKGGELFAKMCDVGNMSEREVARISRDMILGIHEIQRWDMVHLDLKPENLMFSERDSPSRPAELKLIDFGLARIIPRLQKHKAKRPIGTPYYMAPEIITGANHFDRAADLWSIGNISFALRYGFPPFYVDMEELGLSSEQTKELEEEIYRMIREGFEPIIIPDDYGPFFPDDPETSAYCRDLIGGLLRTEVELRYTTTEALSHPFFREHLRKNALPLSLFQALTTESNAVHIQIIASHAYLDRMDVYRSAETIHLFRTWVGNHKDGKPKHRMGKKRFCDHLRKCTMLSVEETEECWKAMHMRPNSDGLYLRLEDFLLATAFVTMRYCDERIERVWYELDVAKEGRLTVANIEALFDKFPLLADYKFNPLEVIEQCETSGGDLLGIRRLRGGVKAIQYENFIDQIHPQFAAPFIFTEWKEIESTLSFDPHNFAAIAEEVKSGPLSDWLLKAEKR